MKKTPMPPRTHSARQMATQRCKRYVLAQDWHLASNGNSHLVMRISRVSKTGQTAASRESRLKNVSKIKPTRTMKESMETNKNYHFGNPVDDNNGIESSNHGGTFGKFSMGILGVIYYGINTGRVSLC